MVNQEILDRQFGRSISHLKSQGLVIKDEQAAADLLFDCHLHRLQMYLHPFVAGQSQLVAGSATPDAPLVSLEVVKELIQFDEYVRIALLETVSRFEVLLRSRYINFAEADGRPAASSSRGDETAQVFSGIELMDFGSLARLVSTSSQALRHDIAESFGMSPSAFKT